MFRITEDPLSGRLVQCLAKNYQNYSIVSIDMDKVGAILTRCAQRGTSSLSIIKGPKSRNMRWAGNVERVRQVENSYKFLRKT